MFAGTGGSGVEDMPSEHNLSMSKKCADCHMYKVSGEKEEVVDISKQMGGHTFRADERYCLKCHRDAGSMMAKWKAENSELVKQLKALLDSSADKTTKVYKEAKLNHDLVRADSGIGFHNPRYAQAILRHSISSLQIKSWDQPTESPDKPE